MKLKLLLAAVVMMGLPAVASAQCSWGMEEQVTMSCADGSTWDAESQSCIPTVTS